MAWYFWLSCITVPMSNIVDGGRWWQPGDAVVHVIELILTELKLLNWILWEVASNCFWLFWAWWLQKLGAKNSDKWHTSAQGIIVPGCSIFFMKPTVLSQIKSSVQQKATNDHLLKSSSLVNIINFVEGVLTYIDNTSLMLTNVDQCWPKNWYKCNVSTLAGWRAMNHYQQKTIDQLLTNYWPTTKKLAKLPVLRTCWLFPKCRQKITGLGIRDHFGTDLGIPNIWLFVILGKNQLWQTPSVFLKYTTKIHFKNTFCACCNSSISQNV